MGTDYYTVGVLSVDRPKKEFRVWVCVTYDGFDLPEQYFINRSLKESDFLKPNNNQLAIPFLNGG